MGPKICMHNNVWARLTMTGQDLSADGKSVFQRPTVNDPTGEGYPDAVTCRRPTPFAASRTAGPEVVSPTAIGKNWPRERSASTGIAASWSARVPMDRQAPEDRAASGGLCGAFAAAVRGVNPARTRPAQVRNGRIQSRARPYIHECVVAQAARGLPSVGRHHELRRLRLLDRRAQQTGVLCRPTIPAARRGRNARPRRHPCDARETRPLEQEEDRGGIAPAVDCRPKSLKVSRK